MIGWFGFYLNVGGLIMIGGIVGGLSGWMIMVVLQLSTAKLNVPD